MIPQGPYSPFHQQRWIEIYNSGSAAIPAYGCAEVVESLRPDSASTETPSGGRTVLSVRRPTSDNVANFVICGPMPVASASYGIGTKDYPTFVAYDTSSTPASGETWGPQSGSCLVKKNNLGLIIDGDANGTIVRCTRSMTDGDYFAEVTLTADPTFSGTSYASTWTATATVTASTHPSIVVGSSITVHDDQIMFPFAKSGAKAKIIRTEQESTHPYYKVVVCQQLALTARATLSGALCGASTATIAGFTVTSPSPFNLDLSPSSADNPRGHAGEHGDDIWLALNKSTPVYEIVDMEKHATDVLVSLRQSGTSLQGNFATIYGERCASTSYWLSLMSMKDFNWWCSGSYYQYCSGSLSSGSGSGSGSAGATCDCTTIPSTLTLTLTCAGFCANGQSVTLTKSGSTWSWSGTIMGDSWSFSWACNYDPASGLNSLGGTLTVTYPSCLSNPVPASPASPAALSALPSSCSPVHVSFGSITVYTVTGCNTCSNSTTPINFGFTITE